MRKAVLFALGSPLLIGSALAGGGGAGPMPSDLRDGIFHLIHLIAVALGML